MDHEISGACDHFSHNAICFRSHSTTTCLISTDKSPGITIVIDLVYTGILNKSMLPPVKVKPDQLIWQVRQEHYSSETILLAIVTHKSKIVYTQIVSTSFNWRFKFRLYISQFLGNWMCNDCWRILERFRFRMETDIFSITITNYICIQFLVL